MVSGKAYFYFVTSLVITMAVVVITYSAIQANMFGGLLVGVVVLGSAILMFSAVMAERVVVPLANLRLKFVEESHEHQRLIMDRRQLRALPAPQPDTDPRRGDALKLLRATLQHANYGPQQNRIISAKDAQGTGVMNRSQRQTAIEYLWKFGVYTVEKDGAENNGTYCKKGMNVIDVYEAAVRGNGQYEAIMALPGVDR